MLFVGITTITAAFLNIKNIYLPQATDPKTSVPGLINLTLTCVILVCVVIIFYNAIPSWLRAYRKYFSEAKAIA
jgi:hypothetical protein